MPQSKNTKELCTPSFVCSAQACTSARLGRVSSSVSVNTAMHLRMGTSKHPPGRACVFKTRYAVDLSQSEVLDHPLFEKLPLGQRAEVRVCLVKCKIGINLTKRGAPWNSC